jgi:hypothetical protein
VEEASGPPIVPWADNVTPTAVFAAMQTQWRVGPAGPYGLDYTALTEVLRMLGIARSEWAEVLTCIRVMEGEALSLMRKTT